jgi:hypothetical protein
MAGSSVDAIAFLQYRGKPIAKEMGEQKAGETKGCPIEGHEEYS